MLEITSFVGRINRDKSNYDFFQILNEQIPKNFSPDRYQNRDRDWNRDRDQKKLVPHISNLYPHPDRTFNIDIILCIFFFLNIYFLYLFFKAFH